VELADLLRFCGRTSPRAGGLPGMLRGPRALGASVARWTSAMATEGGAGHHIAVGEVVAVVASLGSQTGVRVVGWAVSGGVELCRVSRGRMPYIV
jgi:hypothetical protein